MGPVKYVALLVAVGVVAAAVPIAQGTSDKTPTARIAALEAKVTKLQRSVAALSGCLRYKAAALILRGTADSDGYVYQRGADPNSVFLYTAFDATAQGEKADFATAVVNPQCLTGGTERGAARTASERVTFLRFKPSLR